MTSIEVEEPGAHSAPGMAVPWVTVGLVLANLAMFVFGLVQGLDWMKPDADRMVALGGNLAPLTLTGEPWRMATSIFMHGGLIHLAANMYMLIIIGPLAERVFGRASYLAVYLAAGLAGAWLSTYWNWQHQVDGGLFTLGARLPAYLVRPTVSIGASGALMGLAGALLAVRVIDYLRSNIDDMPGLGKSIGQIILINLVMGAAIPGIDQAAHMGGLIGGFFIGGVVMGVAQTPGLGRALVSVVIATVMCGLAYWHVATAKDDALMEFRTQYDEQRREERAAEQKRERRDAIEREAAQDAKNAPAPVAAEVARGVAIALPGASASGFALDAGGQRAYVTDGEANTLAIVDLAQRKLLNVVAGPALPKPAAHDGCPSNTCRGIGAAGVAVSADGHRAYVASMVPDALTIVDLDAGKVIASVPVGRYPRRVLLSPDEKLALVFDAVDNAYTVVDLESQRALGPQVPLPSGDAANSPFGRRLIAWQSQDRKLAYLLDEGSATVVGYDFAKRAALPEVRLGTDRAPDAILPIDAEHWWWGDADGWRAFDVRRGHSETVFVNCGGGDAPTTAALSADTAQIAMFEQRGNLVRLIKRSTGRTVGLFPSEWAHAMAFAPDGKHLYVLSAHALTVIDPAQSLDYRQAIGEAGSDMFCAPQ